MTGRRRRGDISVAYSRHCSNEHRRSGWSAAKSGTHATPAPDCASLHPGYSRVICPSACFLTGVSSLFSVFPKNISVPTYPKSDLELSPSRPTEGRFAIVTDVGPGMRWTRQRFARDGVAGQVERLVSDRQRADERCCSVRRSRVVLTPRRWRQVRGCLSRPNRVQTKR